MRKILLTFILLAMSAPSFAITTYELRQPKDALNRLGIDYEPENKFELIKKDNSVQKNTAKLIQDKTDYSRYTYADLSLKKLANEITQDLDMDMKRLRATISSGFSLMRTPTSLKSSACSF